MSDDQNLADAGQIDPDTTASLNGASAIAYGAFGDVSMPSGSDGSVFLADLAHAMQATAGAQRVRIAESAEERRQAHIDTIRGREAAQTEEYRELAERDIKGVEAWATGEIERIRLERQRRIAARKTELERHLQQHHATIEREVGAVEAAVVAYRDEVDTFFGRLDSESDPIAIARQAGSLPPFPALELIGPDDIASVPADDSLASLVQPANDEAIAQHDEPTDHEDGPPSDGDGTTNEAVVVEASGDTVVAVAEGSEDAPLIGVMDPEPGVPVAVSPWDRREGQEGEPVEADAAVAVPGSYLPPDDDQLIGDSDPEAVGSGVTKISPRSSGAVIQPAASLKPIGSWLRRSNHTG